MNPHGLLFVYKWDGRFSKEYKTYIGCFRAAQKLMPYDTDRIIYAVDPKRGTVQPILERLGMA